MPRVSKGRKRSGVTRRAVLQAAVATPLVATLKAAGITLVRPPYLQNVVGDQATVVWATLEPGIGKIEYSSDRSFSRVAHATARAFTAEETKLSDGYTQYQATLGPLREGISYNYRVVVDDEVLTPPTVAVQAPASGPVKFLVFGDSGQGTGAQHQLAPLMAGENANFILHTGDIAYPDGTFRDFDERHFKVYRDFLGRIPMFLIPGNHDYYTESSRPYRSLFAPPTPFDVPFNDRGRYYSFDWGDVHFIGLDTNDPLEFPVAGRWPMLDWLERDLQRTRKFWRIAFFHHPPFALSPHHEENEVSAAVRDLLMPILDRYQVPLVFCGHDHNYQRQVPMRDGKPVDAGTGTQYFVTGGGGATLYGLPESGPLLARGLAQYHYLRVELSGTAATVKAISTSGTEIDSYVVAPKPTLTPAGVVSAASASIGLSPGSLISIYGQFLAVRDQGVAAFPLPTQLQSTRVTLNGQNLPLFFVSPSQINAQLPFTATGNAVLAVISPNASVSVPVAIAEAAPAIFAAPQPAIIRQDGTLVTPDAPARQGEFLSIFGTGIGSVSGSIAAGQPTPNAPLLSATAPVEVVLGQQALAPQFAGLAPGFAGVYQVVFQVPTGFANGMFTLSLRTRGALSNVVSIPVGFQAPPPPPPPPPPPDDPPFGAEPIMPGAARAFRVLFAEALNTATRDLA